MTHLVAAVLVVVGTAWMGMIATGSWPLVVLVLVIGFGLFVLTQTIKR